MENPKNNIMKTNNEDTGHKSCCTECPAYNECMGVWLDYFSGK